MNNQNTLIITGAASGIGRAIAQKAYNQGYRLALWDINQQELENSQQGLENSDRVSIHACDISQAASVQAATNTTLERHSTISGLVNNAGIAHIGNIEQVDEVDLDRLYNVNVKGIYFCLKAIIPIMKAQQKGAIINLASIASKLGIQDRFAYSMTKGAVLSMTLSVARDYVESGIRCNCICPARVHTPFVDNFLNKNYPGQEEEMLEKLSAYQPIGRMGKPEEIANLALFLISEEASFITGSAYDIDGGVTLLR